MKDYKIMAAEMSEDLSLLGERLAQVEAERDRLRGALDRIARIDPDEWHESDGWKCVEFIQRIAREAAGPVKAGPEGVVEQPVTGADRKAADATHRPTNSEEPRVCTCGHQEWQHVWDTKHPDGMFTVAPCADVEGCACADFRNAGPEGKPRG